MTTAAALATYGVLVIAGGTWIAALAGRPPSPVPRRARGRRDP